jgi:hypothetical protein
MLEGVVWALLGLIVVTMAALSVPVDVAVRLDTDARLRLSLRIGWLFGLVRVRRAIGARKAAAPKAAKVGKKKRGSGVPSLGVIRQGVGLLCQILGRVRIRHAELDLAVGADDPATTGELAGFVAPVVALANALPQTRVTLTPDFTGPTFEGSGEAKIRAVPITLIGPLTAFAFSSEVRRWLVTR